MAEDIQERAQEMTEEHCLSVPVVCVEDVCTNAIIGSVLGSRGEVTRLVLGGWGEAMRWKDPLWTAR